MNVAIRNVSEEKEKKQKQEVRECDLGCLALPIEVADDIPNVLRQHKYTSTRYISDMHLNLSEVMKDWGCDT